MKKVKGASPRKDPNTYPPGWDYQRAKSVASYYDAKKDELVLDEESSSRAAIDLVWMEVPQELVPEVRKLIARRRKSA